MSLINRMLLELDAREGAFNGNNEDIINHLRPVAQHHTVSRKTTIIGTLVTLAIISLAVYTAMRQDATPMSGIVAKPIAPPIASHRSEPPENDRQAALIADEQVMMTDMKNTPAIHTSSPAIQMSQTPAENNSDDNKVIANAIEPDSTTQTAEITTNDSALITNDEAQTSLSVTRVLPGGADFGQSTTTAQNSSERFATAMYYYKQGQTATSLDLLYQTVTLEPDNIDAREFLAGLLMQQQRWQDAEQLLTAGLQRIPDSIELNRMLARIKVEQGQDDLAIALLEKPTSQQPDARSEALLGLLYQRQGQYQDSAEYYRQALRQQPSQGKWWLGLAISLEAQQEWTEASKAYRLAASSTNLEVALRNYAHQRRKAIAIDPTLNTKQASGPETSTASAAVLGSDDHVTETNETDQQLTLSRQQSP